MKMSETASVRMYGSMLGEYLVQRELRDADEEPGQVEKVLLGKLDERWNELSEAQVAVIERAFAKKFWRRDAPTAAEVEELQNRGGGYHPAYWVRLEGVDNPRIARMTVIAGVFQWKLGSAWMEFPSTSHRVEWWAECPLPVWGAQARVKP